MLTLQKTNEEVQRNLSLDIKKCTNSRGGWQPPMPLRSGVRLSCPAFPAPNSSWDYP